MKTQIARTIRRFGEPVEIVYRTGTPKWVTASVQRPFSDGVVNDFDTYGFIVYIPYDDLTQAPIKFDRLRIRGELRSIEEINVEQAKDVNICWMLSVRG